MRDAIWPLIISSGLLFLAVAAFQLNFGLGIICLMASFINGISFMDGR